MYNTDIKSIEKEFEDLLEAERRCLMAANFGAIEAISSQKESLVTKLQGLPRGSSLDRLKGIAASNNILFEAALEGLNLAHHRISDIRNHFGKLHTYNDSGAVSDKSQNPSSVSIKA